VFDLSCTGGGNDRDGNVITDVVNELDVKAAVGALL